MKPSTGEGKRVRVRQTRSFIGRDATFRRTLKALGLGKIGTVREFEVNPALLGALRTVEHIVEITPVSK